MSTRHYSIFRIIVYAVYAIVIAWFINSIYVEALEITEGNTFSGLIETCENLTRKEERILQAILPLLKIAIIILAAGMAFGFAADEYFNLKTYFTGMLVVTIVTVIGWILANALIIMLVKHPYISSVIIFCGISHMVKEIF